MDGLRDTDAYIRTEVDEYGQETDIYQDEDGKEFCIISLDLDQKTIDIITNYAKVSGMSVDETVNNFLTVFLHDLAEKLVEEQTFKDKLRSISD